MICIIEDNDAVRSATTALVRSIGCDACAFSRAEHYLAKPPSPRPACLIVDIHMPGMSGLEMQALLTASGDRTPIIFMTGWPDEQSRSQAVAHGAIAFLIKPFSDDALIDGIATALKKSARILNQH